MNRGRNKRRFLRFGLRTLLLCTVGCSVLFGWVANERRRAEFVSRFMQNGRIEFFQARTFSARRLLQYWMPNDVAADVEKIDLRYAHVIDEDMMGVEMFREARSLDITYTAITDKGFRRLRNLRQLRELHAGGPFSRQITDDGLSHLRKLRQMRSLELRHTGIRNDGLAALQGMTQLHLLSLFGSDIDDAALPHLQQLSGLRKLVVRRTKLSQAAIQQLKKSLPDCEIVD